MKPNLDDRPTDAVEYIAWVWERADRLRYERVDYSIRADLIQAVIRQTREAQAAARAAGKNKLAEYHAAREEFLLACLEETCQKIGGNNENPGGLPLTQSDKNTLLAALRAFKKSGDYDVDLDDILARLEAT